jgi:pimeloyl-ACP methyl ester carboxylesterase
MRNLVYLLLAIGLLLALLKVLVPVLEPKLTFFPFREIPRTPREFGVDYQEFLIPTTDGVTICSWYLPVEDPVAEIIFFHGNSGNLSIGRLELFISIYRRGYSLFAFDYRGFGKSSGSPSEEGIYRDSAAATSYFWDKLHQPENKVVYLGRSLGGVAAAYAATVHLPNGVILEGAFPSKASLLRHYPLFWILSPFSRYELSPLEFLEKTPCPVLVIHGDQDQVVPLSEGQKLYERLETKKEFYLVNGAGHADHYLVGAESYWQRLKDFVSKLTPEA